jgi:hypothetical protein
MTRYCREIATFGAKLISPVPAVIVVTLSVLTSLVVAARPGPIVIAKVFG